MEEEEVKGYEAGGGREVYKEGRSGSLSIVNDELAHVIIGLKEQVCNTRHALEKRGS